MNLLITNPQEDQAYLVLRCLLEEASKIIVTVCGDSLFQRWAGVAQWSRHVSKRCRVPDCSGDWSKGLIQAENTPDEERYIQRIEEICAAEGIDVIFPSFDPEVYVFSKNKSRLASQGILAVVPDYDALTRILDKSLTIKTAENIGFPVPKTCVPASLEALSAFAQKIDPPWVLRPRCSAHDVNIKLVEDLASLENIFCALSKIQERPMMQEYVPVTTKRNYYVVVDRNSEIVSLFSPKVIRVTQVRNGIRVSCAAVVSSADVPYTDEIRALIRELGVWGAMTIQCIVDARDGKPKLMEINPRLGDKMWYQSELGINHPLMVLRIAKGEDPGEVPVFREGVLLLDPLSDLRHLLRTVMVQTIAFFRAKIRGTESTSSHFKKKYIRYLLRNYKSNYFGKTDIVTNPLNRGFFSDPFPPVVRIYRFVTAPIRKRLLILFTFTRSGGT